MADNSKLIEALKKEGIELGEPVEIKFNPIRTREVAEFIRKIEEAHERAKDSKIHFGYSMPGSANVY